MRVLITPAYVAIIERTTQARNTRASLLTYLHRGQVKCRLCSTAETCVPTLPHAHKHHQGHQEEAACAIYAHGVEHRSIFIKQRCCGNDVNLDTARTEGTRPGYSTAEVTILPPFCERTHQQNLYGPQNVHGSSKRCSKIEAEPHSPPKLWPQRSGDHVVRSTS